LANPVKRAGSIILKEDNTVDESRGGTELSQSLGEGLSNGGVTPRATNTSELQF